MIEEVLLQHPSVQLAAAIGQPDAYAGELPVAFVQPRVGAVLDLEALRVFVEARIPERPAMPRHIDVIDPMPLTAIGKVYKPALRVIAAARAFEAALDPLRGLGWGVAVSVRADVSVTPPSGVPDDTVEASLRERLRGFPVGWTRILG